MVSYHSNRKEVKTLIFLFFLFSETLAHRMNIFVTIGAFIFSSEFWTQDIARVSMLSSQWASWFFHPATSLVECGCFLQIPLWFGMETARRSPRVQLSWFQEDTDRPGSSAALGFSRRTPFASGRKMVNLNRCLGYASWIPPFKAPNNKSNTKCGWLQVLFFFLSLPVLILL